jgi:hypothetical protein
MTLYFLPIILAFVFYSIKELKHSKLTLYIFTGYLCVFLCFGYMTGSDWRSYEPIYNEIDFNNLFYNYFFEPGYYIYMLIFKFLKIGFWPFFIFTKVIIFIVFVKIIINLQGNYIYPILMFFIPYYGYYLFIDNPMRNLIAIAIFLISIKYIHEKKIWKYLACILLASSFHFSAIILFPLYWVLDKRISNGIWIFLFIIFNIFFASRQFLILFVKIFSFLPYVETKIATYLIENSQYAMGRIFSVGSLIFILFFILLICSRKYFDSIYMGNIIFNSAIIFLLFYRLATTIEIFSRFQLYFSIFFVMAIISLIQIFTKESRHIYISFLLILSLLTCYKKVTQDYRYVPYTNYLVYLVSDEFPTYDTRSNYNYIHSPYKRNSISDPK